MAMKKIGLTVTLRREQWEQLERSYRRKKLSQGKMKPSTALRRRNGGMTAGFSG
jgi:hypothetical protein